MIPHGDAGHNPTIRFLAALHRPESVSSADTGRCGGSSTSGLAASFARESLFVHMAAADDVVAVVIPPSKAS